MGRTTVFGKLQDLVDVLGIEGGKELITQGHACFLELRRKLTECEKAMVEEHSSIRSDAARVANKLGCTRDALLSGSATLPTIGRTRPLDSEGVEKMTERLCPDPTKRAQELAKHEEEWEKKLKKQAEGSASNLSASDRKVRVEELVSRMQEDAERRSRKNLQG